MGVPFIKLFYNYGAPERKEIDVTTLEIGWSPYGKQVTYIDFSGLTGSDLIWGLSVKGPEIRKLDLSPLATCPNLRNVNIEYNPKLKKVDLSPLSSSDTLQIVEILANFRLVDLKLPSTPSLRELRISGNGLEQVDISPLVVCDILTILTIDERLSILMDSRFKNDTNLPKSIQQIRDRVIWKTPQSKENGV